MGENYRFKVNLGGMIDILANHLYSSPDVFIRELLQNGIDAINARKKLDNSWKDGKITVSLIKDIQFSTIVFEDNGIGLTEDEIHKFIAVIGESSKRSLINGRINDDYIGRFGIGLLSCFMVSNEINLVTRSMKSKCGYHWIGRPDGTYNIEVIDGEISCGTTIYLRSKNGCEDYYNNEKIIKLIKYYGLALPVPIYFNNNGVERKVNDGISFWNLENKSRDDIMRLGEEIFNEKFIDYIPLKLDTGEISGIAYIIAHKVAPNAKNSHRIYLKNMLLTEDGDKVLPDWAFFVKCIFNTNSLRPTASRENFYEDDLLLKTRDELGQCIIKYLSNIAISDSRRLSQIIRIHDLAIKSLAVEDDNLYKIFFDYLLFETSQGTKAGNELRMMGNKLKYVDSVDKFRQISPIFTAQNKLLINCGYVYDAELIEKLSYIYDNLFVELVNASDVVQIMEDLTYDQEESVHDLIKVANIVLSKFQCEADIKHFKPSQLPVVYTVDNDTLIYRDLLVNKEKSNSSFGGILDGFIDEFKQSSCSVLCFNFDNPLIQRLINFKDAAVLKNCIQLLYLQALLMGHFPLRHNEMDILNSGIIALIEWGIDK